MEQNISIKHDILEFSAEQRRVLDRVAAIVISQVHSPTWDIKSPNYSDDSHWIDFVVLWNHRPDLWGATQDMTLSYIRGLITGLLLAEGFPLR